MKRRSRSGRERLLPILLHAYPPLLFALFIADSVMITRQWDSLPKDALLLFLALLVGQIVLERTIGQKPRVEGLRLDPNLSETINLTWWSLLLVSVFEYAMVPRRLILLEAFGIGMVILGGGLRLWARRSLREFFSDYIETWDDQPLIEAGAYRFLRHPAYAGSILQTVGMPLILNAYGSLVLSALLVALFFRRASLEESFLRDHLVGYAEYMKRVGRFIPRLW